MKPQKRMNEEWIVRCITGRAKRMQPQFLHVMKHISGPDDDGCQFKLVSDNHVLIKARFSADAQERGLSESQEDSQQDWSRSLIIVKDYHIKHEPHQLLGRCEFVLCVGRFALWTSMEGFKPKLLLVNCMEDVSVQEKNRELWEDWNRAESSQSQTSQDAPDGSDQSDGLSQLLAEMGAASLSQPSPRKGDKKGCTSPCKAGGWPKLDSTFMIGEFIISEPDEEKLNNIPEWQPDYQPESLSGRSHKDSSSGNVMRTVDTLESPQSQRNRGNQSRITPSKKITETSPQDDSVKQSTQASGSAGMKPDFSVSPVLDPRQRSRGSQVMSQNVAETLSQEGVQVISSESVIPESDLRITSSEEHSEEKPLSDPSRTAQNEATAEQDRLQELKKPEAQPAPAIRTLNNESEIVVSGRTSSKTDSVNQTYSPKRRSSRINETHQAGRVEIQKDGSCTDDDEDYRLQKLREAYTKKREAYTKRSHPTMDHMSCLHKHSMKRLRYDQTRTENPNITGEYGRKKNMSNQNENDNVHRTARESGSSFKDNTREEDTAREESVHKGKKKERRKTEKSRKWARENESVSKSRHGKENGAREESSYKRRKSEQSNTKGKLSFQKKSDARAVEIMKTPSVDVSGVTIAGPPSSSETNRVARTPGGLYLSPPTPVNSLPSHQPAKNSEESIISSRESRISPETKQKNKASSRTETVEHLIEGVLNELESDVTDQQRAALVHKFDDLIFQEALNYFNLR